MMDATQSSDFDVIVDKNRTVKTKKTVKMARHLRSAPPKRLVHATERSVALPFLVSVMAVFLAIVFGVPLMIALVVVVYPLALSVRFLGNNCCIGRRRCPPSSCSCCPMSPQDSIWMDGGSDNDDRDDRHRSNPVSVTLLFLETATRGGPSIDKLREVFLRRVVLAEDGRGRRLYPRFLQRVVALSAGYCWTDDETFDIAGHVYTIGAADASPSVRTRAGLETYLGALVDQRLPVDRPLWEIQLLSDFGDTRDTVLIVRTHHCLSDAISLVRILRLALADVPPNGGLFPYGGAFGGGEKQRFGGTTYPLNVFRAFIVGPMTVLSWLLICRKDCNLLRHSDQHRSGSKLVAWSDAISLSQVVRIKQVSRCTLNDVVLAALTGSLRSFFQRNGISRPYKMKVSLAVDLRYDSLNSKRRVRMGSKYGFVNVTLPVHREGAIPILWEVRSIMEDQMKTSADPVVMYGVVSLLGGVLPGRLFRWLTDRIANGASVAFANIPGPQHPVHVLSMKLKSMLCLVPARDVSSQLAVTVTTNADVLTLALEVDAAVLPRPEQIIDDFVAQIELMSQVLSSRRIPGEHRRRSYFIMMANDLGRIPPVEEVQSKLYAVQEELHEISQRLEASSLSGDAYSARDRADLAASQQVLLGRMDRLKEEFSDLLLELRRRKSVVDGVSISDEDEDLDGEIRRSRKRTLSVSSRRSSVHSVTSTARPLTTSTPSTSHHSSLMNAHDPLMATSGSPELS